MRYFSLFTGVGGFEIGIQNAYENNNERQHISKESEPKERKQGRIGTTVQPKEVLCDTDGTAPLCVGFSEIDKYANQVLKYHYPNIKNYGDITKINWSEVPDFDLLVGGSPCQDFSIAGKRKGILGERSGLVWEFIRCLEEKKPRYFIWENVKGVLSSRRGYDFANIITAFSEVGYNLWWQVLNAKDFGVPQNRERIFVVGFRGESPREVFFEREDDGVFDREGKPNKRRTQAKYSSAIRGSNIKADNTFVNAPQAFRVRNTSGAASTLQGLAGGTGAKTGLYLINKKYEKQKNTADTFGCERCDGELGRGKIDRRGGDRNITNNLPGVSKIRRLTPTECERLMSWPDGWTKYGINEKGEKVEMSDTQRYKMCGNGVVSKVVEEVVRTVVSY